MSYGLTVYTVSLEKLLAVPGSGSNRFIQREGILDSVRRYEKERMHFGDMNEEDAPPNTLEDAVAQIVDGEELNPRKGWQYGYAVEAICRYLGTSLYTPIGFPRPELLDEFLQPLGCPVTFLDLLHSGSPIRIPRPEDFPSIGYWTPEQVAAVKDFFDQLPEDQVIGELALGVSEVRHWLSVAMDPETPQASWLMETLEQHPDPGLSKRLKRLLERERNEGSKPRAVIGFWY